MQSSPLTITTFAQLNDVSITSIADGEIIVWDSGTSLYINQTLAEAGIAAASHTHTASEVTDFSTAADARIAAAGINALSDVTITAAASGDFLRHNGSAWVDATIQASDLPVMVGDSGSGGTKGAVPAPTTGDATKFLRGDGTWASGAGGASALDDLSDVTITSLTNGDVLYVSGGVVINGTISAAGLAAASHTHSSSDITDFSTESQVQAALVIATTNINDLADVTITAAASGDFLRHNGSAWVDATISASDLPAMVGDSGSGGTKGAVPAPAAGDTAAGKFLKADGTWEAPSGGSGGATERLNKLINAMFRTTGHTNSYPVTITDGAYSGPTGWFFLTQNTNVEISGGSGLSNSSHSIIITNQNASSRRAGTGQFVEYYDTLPLRGKAVRFSISAKCSNTKNVRAALINWTGTANAATKDVVNDWTSTTYTESNFFISSASLDIIAVSSAVSVGTSATEVSVSGTVGASTNNILVLVWTEDALSEDETIELSEAMLVKGSSAIDFDAQYYPQEQIDCEYRCRTVVSDGSQTDAIVGWGHGASTTVAVCQVPLGHGMRVVPSLTYTAADWQVADSVGARQDVTALAISSTVSSRKILFMTSTVASGLTVGRGMATVADTTAGRFLKFDAEIGV